MNGNKTEIANRLSEFKQQGVLQFNKILSISISQRIPALTKTNDGRLEVLTALTASLKSAFNNLNLRFAINEDQIIELSDLIIDQSCEDQLSLEDVLLFLQKMLTGSYGKLYDRMDIPLFFEFFEKYRQERHEQLLLIRDEQHTQSKVAGRSNKKYSIERDRNIDPKTFLELWQTFQDGKNEGME